MLDQFCKIGKKEGEIRRVFSSGDDKGILRDGFGMTRFDVSYEFAVFQGSFAKKRALPRLDDRKRSVGKGFGKENRKRAKRIQRNRKGKREPFGYRYPDPGPRRRARARSDKNSSYVPDVSSDTGKGNLERREELPGKSSVRFENFSFFEMFFARKKKKMCIGACV